MVLNMVAEQFRLVVGERISERICEQISDVHVPQVVEQIIEVPKMAEQILDVLVLETGEQSVKLPSTVSEDRIQERTAERIADKFRRLSRSWWRSPGFFPRTGVNSALWSRSMKLLIFPSLRRSLRGLSLRRKERRNRS